MAHRWLQTKIFPSERSLFRKLLSKLQSLTTCLPFTALHYNYYPFSSCCPILCILQRQPLHVLAGKPLLVLPSIVQTPLWNPRIVGTLRSTELQLMCTCVAVTNTRLFWIWFWDLCIKLFFVGYVCPTPYQGNVSEGLLDYQSSHNNSYWLPKHVLACWEDTWFKQTFLEVPMLASHS